MIQSGYTRSVSKELNTWFQREFANADTEWLWGFHKEALQNLLDLRKVIPVRCFLVRYIVEIHADSLQPFFGRSDSEGKMSRTEMAETILAFMEKHSGQDYDSSPKLLKKLTDLVFMDFVSNGFCPPAGGDLRIPDKVRGCVNHTMPRKNGTRELVLWDRTALLGNLEADRITSDELFAFAFGLNMAFEDISFLLRKALKRSDFNLWNWQEFLLYVTFQYAAKDRFLFYQKLKAAFEDDAVTPKCSKWITSANFSTASIRRQTDQIIRMLQKDGGAKAFGEDGELSAQMIDHIRSYKYLMGHSKDYTRTAAKECSRLLNIFYENAKKDIKAAEHSLDKNTDTAATYSHGKIVICFDPKKGLNVPAGTLFYKADNAAAKQVAFVSEKEVVVAALPSAPEKPDPVSPHEPTEDSAQIPVHCLTAGEYGGSGQITDCSIADWKKQFHSMTFAAAASINRPFVYSQGKVIIHYDPEIGLTVPAGTVFYKTDRQFRRKIGFAAEKPVAIAPTLHAGRKVSIELLCAQKEPKMPTPQLQRGYIPGKSSFESRNPYLSNMTNKSYFKAPPRVPVGRETCVTGKITAVCEAGKKIPAGTRFYARNPQGELIEFLSKNDVETPVCEEIWVHCLLPGEEASKGEITDCSIPDWRNRFRRLENTAIGFQKRQQPAKGGAVCNYLYQPHKDNYFLQDVLDIKYLPKLDRVLEGTQLSSTKISLISSGKPDSLTRNDILTLSFLAYMSKLEHQRDKQKVNAANDYHSRYAGFIDSTNEILRKCGYYELYAPNPYDSLLVCLLSSNEAIDSYRNLWSWYLTNKQKEGKKG